MLNLFTTVLAGFAFGHALGGVINTGASLDTRDTGVDQDIMARAAGFNGGWCGVHVNQYQKTNPSDPNSHYHLDVIVYDAIQNKVAQVLNADAPAGKGVAVKDQLPQTLTVTAENIDTDPLSFSYNGQNWLSSAGQCKVGG